MKRVFACLLALVLLLALAPTALAQTWDNVAAWGDLVAAVNAAVQAGDIINITENIIVPAGESLRVNPGVTLNVAAGKTLTVGAGATLTLASTPTTGPSAPTVNAPAMLNLGTGAKLVAQSGAMVKTTALFQLNGDVEYQHGASIWILAGQGAAGFPMIGVNGPVELFNVPAGTSAIFRSERKTANDNHYVNCKLTLKSGVLNYVGLGDGNPYIIQPNAAIIIERGAALNLKASGDEAGATNTIQVQGQLVNNGTINVEPASAGKTPALINNSGTAGEFTNTGVINVQGGAQLLNTNGTLTNSGTLINSGGTLSNAGTLSNSGTLANSGAATFNNTSTLNNTGTLTLAGTVTPGSINVSGGGRVNNNTAAPIPVLVGGTPQTVPVSGTATVYTITFNGNGATSGATAAQSALTGSAVRLNSNGFVKTGYVFAGWNTAANGSGTGYAERATFTPSANVTLYAQWMGTGAITAGQNLITLSAAVAGDPTKASMGQRIMGNTAFQAPVQGLAAAARGCIPLSGSEYATVYLKATVADILNPGASNMRVVYSINAYYQKYINGAPSGAETLLNRFNGQVFYVRLPIPYITGGFVQVEQNGAVQTLGITGASYANAYVTASARSAGYFTLSYGVQTGGILYNNSPLPASVLPGTAPAAAAAITASAPVAAITTTAVVGVPATGGEEPSSIWMLLSLAVVMCVSWLLARREA